MSDELLAVLRCASPGEVTEEQLGAWARALVGADDEDARYAAYGVLADLAARSAFARLMVAEWIGLREPDLQRLGWLALAELARQDDEASPEYFESYLQRIEREILTSDEGMQHAMADAMVAIAGRDPELEEYASEIASRLLGQ